VRSFYNCYKIAILYWNTIKYLKISQLYFRIYNKVKIKRIILVKDLNLSKVYGNWIIPPFKKNRFISNATFKFGELEKNILNPSDWQDKKMPMLWLYNLHYFDYLVSTDQKENSSWNKEIILRWIKENKPGRGVGWEPYPTSLRIVNWIKWSFNGGILNREVLNSLSTQVMFLSRNIEYHLLGNHLFSNAKALVFAGLFFKGLEAKKWYILGEKIINKQLSEQVLKDGANFELSPMYHSIFLEDILDIINIHHLYQQSYSKNIDFIVPKMIKWYLAMSHPDGNLSFFNDSVLDVALTSKEIVKYSKKLGFSNININSGLIDFKESGFSRVENQEMVLLADMGNIGPDYLPGHAHADTLSFELSLFGERFIVNSGISEYGKSRRRLYQRGTYNHSTITIDRKNSSQVWSGFRVGNRSKILNKNIAQIDNLTSLAACHDGYSTLEGNPIHCRVWKVYESSIKIIDEVKGFKNHILDLVFPLFPGIKIIKQQKNILILKVKNRDVKMEILGNGNIKIKKSYFHPKFGSCIKNYKLVYRNEGELPQKIVTRMSW